MAMRRQESFPWIIVMGGAVLYWTIALGIGIPSLYRLLGEPGPARRVPPAEARCVQTVTVDGTPVAFGDCFNIRFLSDASELSPEGAIEYVPAARAVTRRRHYSGPDPEVWKPSRVPGWREASPADRSDPIGRTAF
jgi:hypothetical protein